MATKSSTKRGRKGSRSRKRKLSLHKPNGVVAPRVKKVGGEYFAFLCIDPAKQRSEWMMADFFGNVLVEPRTLQHRNADFQTAIELAKQAIHDHQIKDILVTVERTGNYHLPTKRAFAAAGWEVRLVHPFAVKQYRLPADAQNKTDHTDLVAQHRAVAAGFGLREPELPSLYQQLHLRTRHRRNLVEKCSALACQIKEHLHLTMPGYAKLFSNFFSHRAALQVARDFVTPQAIHQRGADPILAALRKQNILVQKRSVEKIVAWAHQCATPVAEEALLRHAIWTDLLQLYEQIESQIQRLEAEIAGVLAQTPYIRLLAIPGIHVVSAADFAGEMGPIENYINANAITGRAGLYPSRYQSDQTDNAGGLVRAANRRLRATLMRIADNLANHNAHFRMRAMAEELAGRDKRDIRVRIAKTFSRLTIACVAGDRPLTHACCQDANSILEKLRIFHYDHGTSIDVALQDLEHAVAQFPLDTKNREAEIVSVSLEQTAKKRRGVTKLGDLLPLILARLNAQDASLDQQNRTVSS